MTRRLILHGFALVAVLCCAAVAHAEPYTPEDTLAAIEEASINSGVSYAWLRRIVACETGHTFRNDLIGRQGEIGAVQLHPRGLLPAFYRAGYTNPRNPQDAVHFLADQILLGRARAWSCR